MEPDVSIIIVSWNCRDAMADCLASLEAYEGTVSFETIVVDNASCDDTVALVAERFGSVRRIANQTNRGFAAASNQGFLVARGRNILFLNPDTVVLAGALDVLVKTLDEAPDIGACGPRIENPDGTTQRSVRSLPTFAALLHQYTPLRALRVLKPLYRQYKMADFDYDNSADVDTLMGAALCVPRKVLAEVGVLDERFFVYFEEVDLCCRLIRSGYRVRFAADARITHVGGVSASRGLARVYLFRSLFAYLRKHHGRVAGWAMAGALAAGMFVRQGALFVTAALSSLILLMLGQGAAARHHLHRARSSARFLTRDGWLMLLHN